MKVATWNINGVVRRLPLLLDWLSRAQPDVVALQETKATDAEFPKAALAAAGYGAITVGQRPWNGVALLARGSEPIPVRRALPGDAGDRQARYVEAAIDLSAFTLPVILATGDEAAAHDKLLAELDKASGGKTVWRSLMA